MMTKQEREKELKAEYENFMQTREGQEWKQNWQNRYHDSEDPNKSCDFGDYLYDFYPEMLM